MPPRRVLLPLLVAAFLLVLGPGAGARRADVARRGAARVVRRRSRGAGGRDRRRRQLDRRVDRPGRPRPRGRRYRPRGGAWGPSRSRPSSRSTEVAPRAVASAGRLVRGGLERRPATRTATRCCAPPPGRPAAGRSRTYATGLLHGPRGARGGRRRQRDRHLPRGGGPGVEHEGGARRPVGRGPGRRDRRRRVRRRPGRRAVAVGSRALRRGACVRASYRPPGGELGRPGSRRGVHRRRPAVNGLAVTANPGASFTVVWGEASTFGGEISGPPGRRTQRRPARRAGAELERAASRSPKSRHDAGLPSTAASTSRAGPAAAQLAVWQESAANGDRIAASVRRRGRLVRPRDRELRGRRRRAPTRRSRRPASPSWRGAPAVDNLGIANASHRDGAGVWHPVEARPGLRGHRRARRPRRGRRRQRADRVPAQRRRLRGRLRRRRAALQRVLAARRRRDRATLPFSAAADDNWSGPATAIEWLFGDGGERRRVARVACLRRGRDLHRHRGQRGPDRQPHRGERPVPVHAWRPPPPGCGTADSDRDGIGNACDDNNGAAAPAAVPDRQRDGRLGEVFVKLPAGSASASQAQPPRASSGSRARRRSRSARRSTPRAAA